MEERWKESFDLLSLGTFPDGFDKSQKLNLRRYASKFRVSICILKISGVEYADGFIYLVYTE